MQSDIKNDFIRFLIQSEALQFGDFVLKSGQRSPFFVDIGRIAGAGHLEILGTALARTIDERVGPVDILFGPPYKGITMVTATALAYRRIYDRDISICYNRKERKAHGETGVFVGRLPESDERIVVVDDVLSTGGTKLEAIDLLRKSFQITPAAIVVTVDRRRKGQSANLAGIRLFSIVDLPAMADYLEKSDNLRAAAMRKFYEGNES